MAFPAPFSGSLSHEMLEFVIQRDGGLCVLCGVGEVNVAHIVAPDDPIHNQVHALRDLAPPLSQFTRNNPENLICLCPTHDKFHELDSFVLIPGPNDMERMIEHEVADFQTRETAVREGRGDPGRTLLDDLANEIEYIPLLHTPYHLQVHNPTSYDPLIWLFDNRDEQICPLLHFRASPYALLVRASGKINDFCRLRTTRTNAAHGRVLKLLSLYSRTLSPLGVASPIVTFAPVLTLTRFAGTTGSIPSPEAIQQPSGSTPLFSGGIATEFYGDQDTRAGGSPMPSFDDIPSVDQCAGHDPASDEVLATYAKESAVKHEVLNGRRLLDSGPGVGMWRYYTSDDVRNWYLDAYPTYRNQWERGLKAATQNNDGGL